MSDGKVLPHQTPWAVLNKLAIAEWLRSHGKFVRPELTKKQRLELKECFELIDADGSGAISSSEMLTAFHVLGIRTKRSEVEEMLAEVDADGSGEVEYPEFVQIMTTKMDSQTQEDDPRALTRPGKAQPLPFPLLAQAYRRKKLMEAVMQGDKATQERLQARAEEMEQERIIALAELEGQKNEVKKRTKTLSQITKERIRKVARLKKHEIDLPLPSYILENINDDVKQVLFGVHQRASLRRSSMSQTEKLNEEKEIREKILKRKGTHHKDEEPQDPGTIEHIEIAPEKETRFKISNIEGGQVAQLSKQMQAYFKDELSVIQAVRSQLQDKPTLEQQRIKLHAVQSVGNYYQNENNNWDPRGSPIQMMRLSDRERINTPWRVTRPSRKRAPTRNVSHARIIYIPPPKPVRNLREDRKPEWINHLSQRS